jgi:hypothetical protein
VGGREGGRKVETRELNRERERKLRGEKIRKA